MPLVTVDRTYRWEVAFSFLAEDESLAVQIKDLIQERLNAFIYTEHQKEAVGPDGYDTYTRVFGEEARIVVVLYREAWGTTTFTRIEENAIKQRALDESADFTIFISLDKKKPKWLSRTQIWYDFNRFSLDRIAGIIEYRVHEYGGQVREETVVDQGARHKREAERLKKNNLYYGTAQAYIDAEKEIAALFSLAKKNIELITDEQNNIFFRETVAKQEYATVGYEHGLSFIWHHAHGVQSLNNTMLEVVLASHHFFDVNPRGERQIYGEEQYIFYLNEADSKGWVKMKDKSDFKTTEQLVNFWQKDFLERVRIVRLKIESNRRLY